jgi:pimeloyl-ACP methyl ester carboxylesterase
MGVARSACALCPAGFWNRWERAFCKGSLRNTRAQLRLARPLLPRLFAGPALRRAMNRQFLEHAERMPTEAILESAEKFAGAPGFDATLEALHEGHFTGGRDVRTPATVAWGDKDKLLLPRQAERARRAIPQARHLWLPGCGHIPMVDAPETTARAILTSA